MRWAPYVVAVLVAAVVVAAVFHISATTRITPSKSAVTTTSAVATPTVVTQQTITTTTVARTSTTTSSTTTPVASNVSACPAVANPASVPTNYTPFLLAPELVSDMLGHDMQLLPFASAFGSPPRNLCALAGASAVVPLRVAPFVRFIAFYSYAEQVTVNVTANGTVAPFMFGYYVYLLPNSSIVQRVLSYVINSTRVNLSAVDLGGNVIRNMTAVVNVSNTTLPDGLRAYLIEYIMQVPVRGSNASLTTMVVLFARGDYLNALAVTSTGSVDVGGLEQLATYLADLEP